LLVEIRIDETLWNASGDARRQEWRLLISEMIEHCPADAIPGVRLHIVPRGADGTILVMEPLDGTGATHVIVPADVLAPHFRAYLDVCHQMTMLSEGSHSARLEALDMAKRVMHDRAAQSLAAICGALIPDHGTARRLFSLLTSLEFDTTRLHGGHRVTPG
jgi:uncharacterized protein (UPF0262 family)